MHLKNVTKKQLTITQTCFRATRGAGAERLGPGGRCRPRTGAVSVAPREGGPGARGALPGQGRAAEGRVLLSPLTFCNPPPPPARSTPRRPGRLPTGPADAKGWRARVGQVRGSRARETAANARPTHLPSCQGTRRAQPPSAGIRPPGGRMGRALRLKPPTPRRSTRGPGRGAEPRSRLGDLLATRFTSYLSPDCSEESWFWLEIPMTSPHSQRVAALASLLCLPFCSRKTLFS